MDPRYFIKSCADMSELADDSVDLIMTTPPEWEILDNCEPDIPPGIINECYRVLKPGKFTFYNVGVRTFAPDDTPTRNLHLIRHYYDALSMIRIVKIQPGFWPAGNIVVVYRDGSKCEGNVEFLSRVMASRHEHWLMMSKGDALLPLEDIHSDVMFGYNPRFQNDETTVAQILDKFSKPGDLILDPMAGTGTIGVVADRMGRESVMYDIDGDRFTQIVKERMPHVTIC